MGKLILQFIMAVCGCFGFAIVFHVRRSEWLVSSLGGAISWAVYLAALHLRGSDYLAAFTGAAAAALYGEIIARILHAPSTVFTVIASVPLFPGASLYRSTDSMMRSSLTVGKTLAIYTLLFAASMSAGIVITSMAFRTVMEHHPQGKKL